MAQVVKEGTPFLSGPRVVLQRPDLAALLGCVAAAWGDVDFHLTTLYGMLMGSRLPQKGPNRGLPYDNLAHQIFDTVRSLDAKTKLIEELAKLAINDPELLEEIKEAMEQVRRTGWKHRNKLLHARWGISEKYPDGLILLPPQGVRPRELYRESDFNESLNRVVSAGGAVGKLEVKVIQFFKGK